MKQFCEYTDDITSWKNLKAGNKASFNWLFRRYYSELFHYGIKIVPNRDLVKESIQEVFIRVWETRNNLANVENVRSYLLVSVKRMILVKNNKMNRKNNVVIESAENYAFFFEINEFEKHEELSADIHKTILTAINSLTRNQRELIMLFFYHGLSYPEIATILEISIQATRNLMYRSLIHLRESIGEKSINIMKNMLFLLFSYVSAKKVE